MNDNVTWRAPEDGPDPFASRSPAHPAGDAGAPIPPDNPGPAGTGTDTLIVAAPATPAAPGTGTGRVAHLTAGPGHEGEQARPAGHPGQEMTAQPPRRPGPKHGQVLLGLIAIVAAALAVANLRFSLFAHESAWPAAIFGVGLMVLIYGLVAMFTGRTRSPGEEKRREQRALARITAREQRRARRAQRRAARGA